MTNYNGKIYIQSMVTIKYDKNSRFIHHALALLNLLYRRMDNRSGVSAEPQWLAHAAFTQYYFTTVPIAPIKWWWWWWWWWWYHI